MLNPRLLWRDDREFYVRGHYSAIEQAGKNVEKLEALAREEAERAKLTA
jgi:maltooligosyltrehalose synthase